MTAIRKELRRHQVEFQVVKNRLLKRASRIRALGDPRALCRALRSSITYDDVVTPAKVLIERQKKSEH